MAADHTRARRTKVRVRLTRFGWRRPVRLLAAMAMLPLVLSMVYWFVPPLSTLMVRDLVTFQGYERSWIDLDETAPVLLHSIIASEDQTFCSHHGVQWDALQTQYERWRAGESARGASTLTMQLARNLFLWPGRSVVRKGLEVPLALMLDAVLSKRRLMALYLNIVELGEGVYGFEAAAQRAYGRSASDLTRRQAALLVAALPLPLERDAAAPTGRQAALADTISRRAHQMGAYVGCLAPPTDLN